MRKNIIANKIIALGLAVAVVLPLVFFDVLGNGIYEDVKDTDYSITFYWGPSYKDFTDAEVTRMKEAGFDVATIYNMPWGDHSEGRGRISQIYECVAKLQKQGINASVNDGRISGLINKDNLDITREEMEKQIKRVKNYLKDRGLDNITEFYLADEPPLKLAPVLKMAVELMREYFPDCTTYINLLPIYAHPDIMGTDDYEEYVETYARDVNPDYLCTDYYTFVAGMPRLSYAENLEILKKYAEKYDLETRFIVLCSRHLVYKNVTRQEISWQANLSLLYGNKQVSWFTYSHPEEGYYDEMIDKNGNATQHYYDIQAENKVNRVLGNALYNTDVDRVFSIGAGIPKMEEYSSYGKLGKIKSGSGMFVSFYDNDYFMMMSKYSEGVIESTVTADVISGLLWCNPETNRWEGIANCPYVKGDTVTLTAGQAVLFRTR